MNATIEVSVEDFFNERTGEFDPPLLSIFCPRCGAKNHPLPAATVTASGWRWRGVSHQEPYTDYQAACTTCEDMFAFTVVSPQ